MLSTKEVNTKHTHTHHTSVQLMRVLENKECLTVIAFQLAALLQSPSSSISFNPTETFFFARHPLSGTRYHMAEGYGAIVPRPLKGDR